MRREKLLTIDFERDIFLGAFLTRREAESSLARLRADEGGAIRKSANGKRFLLTLPRATTARNPYA